MRAALVRFGYASTVVLAAVYLIVTLAGPKGVQALVDKQRDIQKMQQRNLEIEKEIELRRLRIERLGKDRDEQDKIIEERFKYVRPGEKVYMLPGSAASGSGTQATPSKAR
jgi:cell division protein FtsB